MEEIFNLKKLYRAYLDCRKAKRKTINALQFEWNLERNLFCLQKDLASRTYQIGRSICFAVKEPSQREIFAAEFRDRVAHHLLINEIIGCGERNFIFDSFSCRKGKGTHAAVRRLKQFAKKATKNYKKEAQYLQLDVSGFFMAIDHAILYSLLEKLVLKQNKSYQWKADILWLAKIIIYHKPTQNYLVKGNRRLLAGIPPRKSLFHSPAGKGLPIGNYSSQFFANLYLNELDQFVKREIGCRYYLRFVDDFILLDKDPRKLVAWRDRINDFLEEILELKISFNKQKIQPLEAGIDFLGYFTRPRSILARQIVVGRLKSKLRAFDKMEKRPEPKKVLSAANSYYGHFNHAYSFCLRKNIYENFLGDFKEQFEPKLDYHSLAICQK